MNSISEYDNGLDLDDLDDCWDDRSINSEDDSAPPPLKKTKPLAVKSDIVKKKAKVTVVKVKEPLKLAEKKVTKKVTTTEKQEPLKLAEKKVTKKVTTIEKQVSKAKLTTLATTKSDTTESGKAENTGESSFPLDQFDLTESTIQLLKDRGIESLFPIQAETFWPIREGKDLIGRARTGQGEG
jgi:ATP-dependent RNA helicase DDX21